MQKNELFEQKAIAHKRPLKHRTVRPVGAVTMETAENAFQKLQAVPADGGSFPLTLHAGDSIILDFGDHCVGFLHFTLNHFGNIRITDSPVQLAFTFGEFPLEIVTPPESYRGSLGKGWLQNETKNVVFTPYTGSLERRYSFRYLKIERTDNAVFPISVEDLYADCVSAVDMDSAPQCSTTDPLLAKIYEMSVKTLKECEQDVFEDGPKRDRRLWIGDLRLQALTDYVTFQNADLVKRCLYLFAAYKTDAGLVSPYVFPDSPPYIDGWTFIDYSLFFVSCLYDYVQYSGDQEILKELYPTAKDQIMQVCSLLDKTTGKIQAMPFIDWCPDLDKETAILGVYLYTLRQFCLMTEMLGAKTDWILKEIRDVKEVMLRFYDKKSGLFLTSGGQLSWHSQIWAIISEAVCGEEALQLLRTTLRVDPQYIPHTPYMMHCYLEALDKCGLQEEVLAKIKDFWGQIAKAGFDCCPEIFNPGDPFESPYDAPEINSACHAWSCTPAYWIAKYFPQ